MKEIEKNIMKENLELHYFINKSFTEFYKKIRQINFNINNITDLSIESSKNNLLLLENTIKELVDAHHRLNSEFIRVTPLEILLGKLNNFAKETFSFSTLTYHYFPKTLLTCGVDYRLEWILQELIKNAVQFCQQKPPLITLTFKKEATGLLIGVKDNGPGIPSQDLDRIFGPYETLQHDKAGKGCGLFFCEEIIRKMTGEIWCESRLGKGSSFFIRLPLLQEVLK